MTAQIIDGKVIAEQIRREVAEEVARMTAANLHGEFATVRSTADVLAG